MVNKWKIQIPELTGEEERNAYIYLPESYQYEQEKRYPVLYMFDGHNVFFDSDATYGKSWGMKEYMDYTQTQLKTALQSGEFVFHNVSGEVRVLDDINTMVTTTDTQGDVFKDNQTIRIIDQIANDDAVLFNTKYLGKMPNNQAGRTALWTDLVKLRKELQRIGAIENFNESDVKVLQGDTKKAVVVENAVTVVNAMSKMYMTVTIS